MTEPIPRSLSVTCPYCGAGVGETCFTQLLKPRPNNPHALRWKAISHAYRTREMVYRMKEDSPEFGLKEGDELLCVAYPYDAKVTVLHRISDGYEPRCNQYHHSVQFVRFA